MPKEEVALHLGLCPSSKCNRNCLHCSADASMEKGCLFTLENALFLASNLRKLAKTKKKLNFFFTFTGDGEPLINPDLVGIFDILFGLCPDIEISFITSGVNSPEEEKRLLELVKRPYAKKINFHVSFNLFQKDFPKRIVKTMEILFKNGIDDVYVKICLTNKGAFRSIGKLDKIILKNFSPWIREVRPIIFEEDDFPPINLQRDAEPAIANICKVYLSDITKDNMADVAYLGLIDIRSPTKKTLAEEKVFLQTNFSQSFSFKTIYGKKRITYAPHFLTKRGRARNFQIEKCCRPCAYLRGSKFSSLYIGADGYYYPDCECPPVESLRLGHVKDRLKNVIVTFFEYRKFLLMELISGRRNYSCICDHCIKVANQMVHRIGQLPMELLEDF